MWSARQVALDSGRFPGISTDAGPVDLAALIDGKRSLMEAFRTQRYLDIADDLGWTLFRGEASFDGAADRPRLVVTKGDGGTETVEAAHFVIATGARPTIPAINGLARVDYLTSTTAMELSEVPESMLVLGGGYVSLARVDSLSRR